MIKGIPKESEFNIEKLLEMIENDEEVWNYLPDWSSKHIPDKQYLFNIVNTVHFNSMANWIKEVKEVKLEEI